ncbi:30S ribosomal protein S4 [candidate division WS5 bacterium]|uniref:Small ribosomal subunit protein uS4 n=1 Tax=candidate division WS5 bacterium TaxID=2093353 RepID=A0A419DA94_9BACT|nr:MAG: 30S ribosomal protein S4 [candidate division WS5 bacterium]
MAKIQEQCRQCRREGEKLFLKGERCNSQKCAVFRRTYAPGIHGLASGRRKSSDYGIQLREKQKVKRIYGILEGQFRNYYEKADAKQGLTGEILLKFLEMRLDNIVYRMGLAPSRRLARQLVGHGHFTVNGKGVNIPSYEVKAGDKIEVKKSSQGNSYFSEIKKKKEKSEASWVLVDLAKLKGEVKSVPEREELDPNIQEQLIVELYSK